jgi:hypothetical protein
MKILVINLESRADRLQLFMEHWKWIGTIERIDGILSPIPHTGCGLAHCKAIRKGLEEDNWCLVLEDDARLQYSREEFLRSIEEATNGNSDAAILGPVYDIHFPEPHIIVEVSENFIQCSRTKSIESTAAVVWSKRCLPILDVYQNLLHQGYVFPIDRMLTTFDWISDETVGWHTDTWIPIYDSVEIYPRPTVWISTRCLVYQEPGLISDNTLQPSMNHLHTSMKFFNQLSKKAIKQDLQEQTLQQ